MKKKLDLRLIAELMKNSRQSDRELARKLGCSQPTITRMRNRLEKEGYIKEYTVIPDFRKLGYQVMGVTLIKHEPPLDRDKLAEATKAVTEIEMKHPHSTLMAVSGMGLGKDRLFINFYDDYDSFENAMNTLRGIPNVDVNESESFLVSLNNESNYRILSMAAIARHLSQKER